MIIWALDVWLPWPWWSVRLQRTPGRVLPCAMVPIVLNPTPLWWLARDSNTPPPGYEPRVLPLHYTSGTVRARSKGVVVGSEVWRLRCSHGGAICGRGSFTCMTTCKESEPKCCYHLLGNTKHWAQPHEHKRKMDRPVPSLTLYSYRHGVLLKTGLWYLDINLKDRLVLKSWRCSQISKCWILCWQRRSMWHCKRTGMHVYVPFRGLIWLHSIEEYWYELNAIMAWGHRGRILKPDRSGCWKLKETVQKTRIVFRFSNTIF